MDFSLLARLAAEFLGTAILIILGNGAVANVDLN
ncbi:MAG TPA: aquaporin, partial [Lactobacillus sp.]|nr:aquaporin [Lactobacillus sp.]